METAAPLVGVVGAVLIVPVGDGDAYGPASSGHAPGVVGLLLVDAHRRAGLAGWVGSGAMRGKFG